MNLDWNSRKIIQRLAKSWNSPRFCISRVWNPGKTAIALLGNPENFSLWNSQMRSWNRAIQARLW